MGQNLGECVPNNERARIKSITFWLNNLVNNFM